MEKSEKVPSVSASIENRPPEGEEVPAPVQTGIPTGISKAPWIPPALEPMGPVDKVTNGAGTSGPPLFPP